MNAPNEYDTHRGPLVYLILDFLSFDIEKLNCLSFHFLYSLTFLYKSIFYILSRVLGLLGFRLKNLTDSNEIYIFRTISKVTFYIQEKNFVLK